MATVVPFQPLTGEITVGQSLTVTAPPVGNAYVSLVRGGAVIQSTLLSTGQAATYGPYNIDVSFKIIADQGRAQATHQEAFTSVITPPAPFPRNRVALCGDSLLLLGFNYTQLPTTPGSFVVNNGIITLTMAGTLSIQVGQSLLLANNSATTFQEDPINGTNPVVLTYNPATFTVTLSATFNGQTMANGDYSNAYGGQWVITVPTLTQDSSWFQWLNNYMNGAFLLVADYAIGGTLSSMPVNLWPKTRAGAAFDILVMQCGTNDINNAASYAAGQAVVSTILNNLTTMIANVSSYGAKLLYGLPAPFNAAAANMTQAQANICISTLRTGVKALLAKNQGVLWLADLFADSIDGTSVNGASISGYNGDGLHPGSTGCVHIAQNERAQLASILGGSSFDIGPVSILEDSIDFAQAGARYPNIVPHGMMDGTVAVSAGGWSGTQPTAWSVLSSTVNAVVSAGQSPITAIANTNVAKAGYCWDLTLTATAAQSIEVYCANFAAQIVAGGWYRFGMRVYFIGAPTALNQLQGNCIFGPGPPGNIVWNGLTATYGNGYPLAAGESIYLYSNPVFFPVPPGSGSAFLSFKAGFSGAGSAHIQLSNAFARQIDNPRA